MTILQWLSRKPSHWLPRKLSDWTGLYCLA
jgi:hypothetical protein